MFLLLLLLMLIMLLLHIQCAAGGTAALFGIDNAHMWALYTNIISSQVVSGRVCRSTEAVALGTSASNRSLAACNPLPLQIPQWKPRHCVWMLC